MKVRLVFALIFVTLQACISQKPQMASCDLVTDTITYNSLSLKEAVTLEQKLGSLEDRDTLGKYYIGSDLYPNKKGFELSHALIFNRVNQTCFLNKVEYYFDKRDSSVKTILYEWNSFMQDDKLYSTQQQSKNFRSKFEQLEKEISKKIGKPFSVNLESEVDASSYRDDIRWINKEGATIYLFMFGGYTGYGQIRIVIYWE